MKTTFKNIAVASIAGILVLVLGVSCAREYDDGFNGTEYYSSSYTQNYLSTILSNLLVDNMQAMEYAIIADNVSGALASGFSSNGKGINETGAVWTVLSFKNLSGTVIKKGEEKDTWTLTREGDYPILSNEYPTEYTITLTKTGNINESHFNWEVSVQGFRTERGGYECTFNSDGKILFTGADNPKGWDNCKGSLFMFVTKYGKVVDKCCLICDGGRSSYRFYNGL